MTFTPLSYQERVNFYLGESLVNGGTINLNDYPKPKCLREMKWSNNTKYVNPLEMLLKRTGHHNKKFYYKFGDISSHQHKLTLVKNRGVDISESVILRSLNFSRHWGHYYLKPRDIPFIRKKPIVFWRGVTTGCPNRPGNRFCLVDKWFGKHPNVNVGFSKVCRERYLNYQKYVLGLSPIVTFLNYKYLISVEGNDKDSGLNWKLNSNSLVLMPKPRITSWLMETTLVPDYHYLLIQDDFSDLADRLAWCEKNQGKCLAIIRNAHAYMNQFKTHLSEKRLEMDVINKYFKILGGSQ